MAEIVRILAANIRRQFVFVIINTVSTHCLVQNFQLICCSQRVNATSQYNDSGSSRCSKWLNDRFVAVVEHCWLLVQGRRGCKKDVGTNGSLCLICKQGTEDVTHVLLNCLLFKENVDSVLLNIKARIMETNPFDGTQIYNFISNLDQDSKVLLLPGGLPPPFDNVTAILINRFMSSAVGKIYKLHTNKLRDLEALLVKDK